MKGNVGFIGLGAMGYPMAMNVRKGMDRNATLYLYDVFQANCARFKEEFEAQYGPIEIASSPKNVAENATTIVSIVPAGSHVRDVYLNESTGIIAAKSDGDTDKDASRLYVECSTIDIDTAKFVGEQLARSGMGVYVDAPVSGGVPAAEKGALSLLIGAPDLEASESSQKETISNGSSSTIQDRLHTIVQSMGDASKLFYCGELGAGLAAKICNNYLSCTILLANAEAMATGIKLGLDKKLLHKVIQNSSGQNFMCDHVCPVPGVVAHAPSSNGYKLGFKAQMLMKDVGLGVDAANRVGIKPSIGEAAMHVYKQVAVDERCIDRDASVVYRFLGGPE